MLLTKIRAFSTTGNLEGQNYIKNKKLVSLSEQNLVDCDHNCVQYEGEQSCDSGCNGGKFNVYSNTYALIGRSHVVCHGLD